MSLDFNALATKVSHIAMKINSYFRSPVDILYVYGDGTVYTDATITAALTAIGSTESTIKLAPGTWTISNNLTIPTNIVMDIPKGAILSIASGKTVTFSSQPEAGLYQVFAGSGGVLGLKYARAEWFGTGSACLNKALVASTSIEVVNAITLDNTVILQSNRGLYSKNNAIITTAGYGLSQTAKTDMIIEGFAFNQTIGGATTIGGSSGTNITIRNNKFYGFNAYGVALNGTGIKIIENEFTGMWSSAALAIYNNYDFIVSKNRFHDIGLVFNLIVRDSSNGIISDNVFSATPNNPLFIDTGSKDLIVKGNTIRDSGDSGILLGNDAAGSPPNGIIIIGNVVDNCPDAGIGTSTAAYNITVIGNILKNNGSGGSRTYDSGIMVYGDSWAVSGNSMLNTPGSTSQTHGIYIFNPALLGSATAQHTAYAISGNTYNEMPNKIVIPYNSGNLFAKIDIKEGITVDYPTRINFESWAGAIPANITGLTSWSSSGVGVTTSQETTTVVYGSGGKVVAGASAEGGFDLSLLALNLMQTPCILELTGYVRGLAAADAGSVKLYTTAGGSSQNTSVNFSGSVWTQVTLRMAIGLTSAITVLFYGNAGKTVYFDEFQIRIVHYNN